MFIKGFDKFVILLCTFLLITDSQHCI